MVLSEGSNITGVNVYPYIAEEQCIQKITVHLQKVLEVLSLTSIQA
jgi:hypothetical protein